MIGSYHLHEYLHLKQYLSNEFWPFNEIMNIFRKQEYGLTLLMSTDPEVNKYLDNVLAQIQDWLEQRKVATS